MDDVQRALDRMGERARRSPAVADLPRDVLTARERWQRQAEDDAMHLPAWRRRALAGDGSGARDLTGQVRA
jgi:hypothetical protein